MRDSEPLDPPDDDGEALRLIIEELTRAIDLANSSQCSVVRELLVQARREAEAQLGQPPFATLQ